ncbi:MAG: MFS transporter [Jatrophihabitantaceae bacterium]
MTSTATAAGRQGAPAGRDLRLIVLGRGINLLGTGVTRIAIPLLALQVLHASPFDIGALGAAALAAWFVVALPAGALLEGRRLRRVMIASDLMCAAALLSIPVATGIARVTLSQLLAVCLIVGVATVIGEIAGQAFLPEVVSRDEIITANSLLQTSESIANSAGPALGGVLVKLLGAAWTVCVDVASYLASVAAVASVRSGRTAVRSTTAASDRRAGTWTRIRVGLRYVITDPVLRPLALMATVLNFLAGGFDTLVIPFLAKTVHVPPAWVGLLVGIGSVGAIFGSALAPRLVRAFGGPFQTMFVLVLVAPAAALLVPMAMLGPRLGLFIVGYLVRDVAIAAMALLARSYRQMTVPAELLTRTTASIKFMSWGVLPLGALFGGLAGQLFGYRGALWLLAALLFIAPAVLYCSDLRRDPALITASASE